MTKEKKSFDPIGTNAEILRFFKQQWNQLFDWLKPKPTDTFLLRSLKAFGKVLAVIAFIVLSPIVAVTLFIAFLLAF